MAIKRQLRPSQAAISTSTSSTTFSCKEPTPFSLRLTMATQNNNGSELDPNPIVAETPEPEAEKIDTLDDEIPIEKIVEKITLAGDPPSVEMNGNEDKDYNDDEDDSENESESESESSEYEVSSSLSSSVSSSSGSEEEELSECEAQALPVPSMADAHQVFEVLSVSDVVCVASIVDGNDDSSSVKLKNNDVEKIANLDESKKNQNDDVVTSVVPQRDEKHTAQKNEKESNLAQPVANNRSSSEQGSFILPSNFEEVATGVLKCVDTVERDYLDKTSSSTLKKMLEKKIPEIRSYIERKVNKEFGDWLVEIRVVSRNLGQLAIGQDSSARQREGDKTFLFPEVKARIFWPRRLSRGFGIVKCDKNDVNFMLKDFYNLAIGGRYVRCAPSNKSMDGIMISGLDRELQETEILDVLRNATSRRILDFFMVRGGAVGNPPCSACEETLFKVISPLMPKVDPHISSCRVQVFPPEPKDSYMRALINFDGRLHLEAAKALEEIEGKVLPRCLSWQKIMCEQLFHSSLIFPAPVYRVIAEQLQKILANFNNLKGLEWNLNRTANGSHRLKITANVTKTVAEVRKPLEELSRGKIFDHGSLTPAALQLMLSKEGISLKCSIQQETQTYIVFDKHSLNLRIFSSPEKIAVSKMCSVLEDQFSRMQTANHLLLIKDYVSLLGVMLRRFGYPIDALLDVLSKHRDKYQELQKLEVTVPMIVVGCKLDLRDESQQVSLERLLEQLLQEFKNVATCIECSATTLYQVRCFNAPLQSSEITDVKTVVLWSLGCIFAELFTLKPLFPGTSDIDQISRIIRVLGNLNEEAWNYCSKLPDYGRISFPKVETPDRIGRESILKVHVSKNELPLAKDVYIADIASMTTGFTGADLANIVNEAALLAGRKNNVVVEKIDFIEAVERIVQFKQWDPE